MKTFWTAPIVWTSLYIDNCILQSLGIKPRKSDTGTDFIQTASERETVFVLSEFEGDVFHNLSKAEANIVGPPVIYHCAKENKVCVH